MKHLFSYVICLAFIVMAFFSFSCKKKEEARSLGGQKLLIDDLEGRIEADSNYGNGAACEVSFASISSSPADVYSGSQSMKINYEKNHGGYLYCARGFGLKPAEKIPQKKLVWSIKPENIDFEKYNAIGFYIKGSNTGHSIAIDLFDKNREIFRHVFTDDSNEWKEIIVPFTDFKSRGNYQPDWNNKNEIIDFPIVIYQFEPLAEMDKTIKGSIIIDAVHFDAIEALATKLEKEESDSSKISPLQ